jgi:Rac GTPase-activating protein 1
MAPNFEDCHRRWLRVEQDLGSCKEVLAKAETERGALEVKLKHARNQVDVEIRRRQKAEANCEKFVCIHIKSNSYFILFSSLVPSDWFTLL